VDIASWKPNPVVEAQFEGFLALVEANKTKKWFLFSHDAPDPDSMASIMGLEFLLKMLGVESIVGCHFGPIGDHRNMAMKSVLDISLNQLSSKSLQECDWNDSVIVLLDCSPGSSNISCLGSIPAPKLVIDHHRTDQKHAEDCLYIVDMVGATSTLICNLGHQIVAYLREGDHDFLSGETQDLATALAVAIKTDTRDFRSDNVTPGDFRAYQFASQYASEDDLDQIVNYQIPSYVMDYLMQGWKNRLEPHAPNFITGIGFINPDHKACLSLLAEEFLQVEGVGLVVVYGLVENALMASVRIRQQSTRDARLVIDGVFGKEFGGTKAKNRVGGAAVPFNIFDVSGFGESDKAQFWGLVKTQVESKFIQTLSK